MIFDHTDNYKQYGLNGLRWEKAFSFLDTLNTETPKGEYPIMEDDVHCRVATYETRNPDEGRIDSRSKYLDIQICLCPRDAHRQQMIVNDKIAKIKKAVVKVKI